MRVGVIGAGISGLLCAQRLLESSPSSLNVTVFEWGRGPGGRTARRRAMAADGTELSFDHAAPFFSTQEDAFTDILHSWQDDGIATHWKEASEDEENLWVGVPTNHAICRRLAEDISKHDGASLLYGRHVRAARHDAATNEWIVRASNRAGGEDEEHHFDALVFSDKLLLLPNPYAVLTEQDWGPLALPTSLTSKGAVVLMLALEQHEGSDAGVRAPPVLRGPALTAPLQLLVHDSAKPARQEGQPTFDLWVAHSTPSYLEAHLAGDDPPGLDDEAVVHAEMLEATLRALGRPRAQGAGDDACAAQVAYSSVFAWDHAQPTEGSRLDASHLLDASRRAGVCGDFFAGNDGRREGVEAAALSGRELADALLPHLST